MVDWDKIGKISHYAYNPPETNEADKLVWNWYHTNCSEFVHEFGVMSMLIESMGFKGLALRLFISKLSMIHAMFLKISKEKKEK